MRVDIDFVGEATSSIKAAEMLDRSLKHLAEVALQVSKALADVEIPTSNVAKTVAAAKTMERSLNSLENQAQRTKRQVAEVSLVQSGLPTIGGLGGRRFVAGPGGASSSSSWAEFSRVLAQMSMWIPKTKKQLSEFDTQLLVNADLAKLAADRMKNVQFAPGQAAKNRAESKVIAEGVENIGEAARRSRRQMTELALSRAAIRGGSGRGGFDNFLLGRSGTGASTQSLGAIVPGGAKATGPALAAAVGVGITALAPLLPAVTSSLAAIPALATAGVGAIATLALAFHGLGAAIDGDQKAFKALDPQAQQFVQTIRSIIPWVHSLSHIALHELAPSLTKALHSALSPGTVGVIENGLKTMGQALGKAAEAWGKFFGSADFQQTLGPLLQAGAHWMVILSDATLHFTDALLHLGVAAIPFTNWMIEGIDKGAKLFDTWIKGAQASGQLTKAIDAGKESLRLVGGLVVGLVQVLYQLVRALAPAGAILDKALIQGLRALAGWLEKNRQALIEITTGAVTAFIGVLRVLGPIVNGLFQALNSVVHALGGWTDAFRILIGLGIAKLVASIATTIVTKLVPAEILAGTTATAMAGPWGILLGLATAIALTWLQIVDAMGKAQIAGTTQYQGATTTHKFKDADQQVAYSRYVNLRRSASKAKNKKDREAYLKLARAIAKENMLFPGYYEEDQKAGAFVPGTKGGKGGTLQLQTNYPGSAHDTSGIPGYQPSHDIATKVGQKILAPEDGQLFNRHFIAYDKNKVGGWTIYFQGSQSGQTYFMTHLGSASNNGYYKKGDIIGTGGKAVNGMQHVHVGIVYGKGATTPQGYGPAQPGGIDTRSTNTFGTPPPFDKNVPKPPKPAMASKASITNAITAIKKDIIALGNLRKELASLGLHDVTKTIEGITLTATVGAAMSAREQQLKRQIAVWQKELVANEKYLRTHKHLTAKQVAQIRADNAAIRAAINQGMTDLKAIAQARADAFGDAWNALTDRAMQQFDKARDAFFKAFDKETSKHKTPTEIIIEQLTSAHEEQALQDAIDEARKNLDDALKGLSDKSAEDTVNRISEIAARYSVAMAVDKAQAAVLGGGVMDLGPQMLKEIQNALSPTSGGPDPEAVKQAQKDLDEALYNQKLYFLQKTADSERALYDEQRQDYRDLLDQMYGDLRDNLARQLQEWGDYWKAAGATAAQAAAIFAQVWLALTGQTLPPITAGPNVGFPGAPGSPGSGPGVPPSGTPGAPPGAIPPVIAPGQPGYNSLPASASQDVLVANGAAASLVNANYPNPGAPGAAAVSSAGGSGTRQLSSVWDINSPSTYDALNAAAKGGGSLIITEGDPEGPKKAQGARDRGIPFYVQVNWKGETPEQFAAKVANAKAAYPGAAGFILDVEGGASKEWSAAAAPLVKNALGGTPFTVTNEPNKGALFNYTAWSGAGGNVMVQAYGTNPDGSLFPWDVQKVVDDVVASGVPREKVIPVIYPGEPLGSYSGPYSVYGIPGAGDYPTPSAPAPVSAPSTPSLSSGAKAILSAPPPSSTQLASAGARVLSAPAPTATQLDAAAARIGLGGGGTPVITPITKAPGSVRMMAEGGILSRPTLMVAGERGREAVIPLDDPRAQNLLGGDVQVHLNFADGMEWLRKFISVEVTRGAESISLAQGKNANLRSRERRY